MGALDNGGGNARNFQLAIDADVELATRQLTGRATARLPEAVGADDSRPQVADLIIAQGVMFTRQAGSARWQKRPANGPDGGPTNAEVAAILTALLAKPSVTLELGEPAPCSLGTCDRVIAHVAGESLWPLLAPLLGLPDPPTVEAEPRIDLDILVDQATSILSELRAETATAAGTTTLLLTISNPGDPILVGPPPAALIDDFGESVGGGGEPVPPETFPPSIAESPPPVP
jgi:hypothetical protein